MKKLLVKNIGLLATPEGKSAHRGSEQGKIKFLKDAWVLIEDGVIASVGTGEAPAAVCNSFRFLLVPTRENQYDFSSYHSSLLCILWPSRWW